MNCQHTDTVVRNGATVCTTCAKIVAAGPPRPPPAWICTAAACQLANHNNYSFCEHCEMSRFPHLVGPRMQARFATVAPDFSWDWLTGFTPANSRLLGIPRTGENIARALFPVYQQRKFLRDGTDYRGACEAFCKDVGIVFDPQNVKAYTVFVRSCMQRVEGGSTTAKKEKRDDLVAQVRALADDTYWNQWKIVSRALRQGDGEPSRFPPEGMTGVEAKLASLQRQGKITEILGVRARRAGLLRVRRGDEEDGVDGNGIGVEFVQRPRPQPGPAPPRAQAAPTPATAPGVTLIDDDSDAELLGA